MTVRGAALLLVALLTVLAPPASAGTVRVGLFVGNNVGFGTDTPLTAAEREARDLAALFQDMGDLTRERTFVVTGATAPQLQGALRQVEAQVREASARGDDVMLVFTYSGHASREGLHLAGTLLPMDTLRAWLETSQAQVRVAFVDACESGTLARERGGSPVETVAITVDDALTMSGLAIVASTGPLAVARESETWGGGVFTRALLTGLRGSADTDADGQITLDEAYRHAFEATVIGTSASAQAPQRPEYRYEIAGVGQVVLTRIPARAAGLVLPEELEGNYTVVSVSDGQVVARIDKQPGAVHRLALPTGRYVVRKVRREDVLLAEVDLAWGGDRWLSDDQMTTVALGDPASRGGWNPRPVQFTVSALGATPALTGSPLSLGADLQLRWALWPSLGLTGWASWTQGSREEWTGQLLTRTTRLGLGVTATRRLARNDLVLSGGLAGTLYLQRIDYLDAEEEDEPIEGAVYEAAQLAPGGWIQGGLHVPVGPAVGLDAGVRAQLTVAQVGEQVRLLPEAQVLVGVTVGFRSPAQRRALTP